MLHAIVYTSNAGSTARYAQLLGQVTGLPIFSAQEAHKNLANGDILYLGWVMAGTVKGYQQAAKRYRIHAVCAVGLSQTGTQIKQVREKTHIPAHIPLFTLQGAFHLERLRGAYKLMMQLMVKTAGKSLAAKPDRTPEEDDLLAEDSNALLDDGADVAEAQDAPAEEPEAEEEAAVEPAEDAEEAEE